jgi:hypothetical protein
VSDEELSRIRGDLLNLDRFLGPYPFDVWKRWKDLTSKVTGMCNASDSTQSLSSVLPNKLAQAVTSLTFI